MIDLNPHQLETVKRILAEHLSGCEVRAFGSRATWTAKEHSDLDLVVMSSKPLDWNRQCLVSEAFEESDLPIRVDVVDWESLSEGFRQAIDGDCVVLQEAAASSNWRETTLGECARLVRNSVSPADFEDSPYIGLEHIGEDSLSLIGVGKASDVTSAKSQFECGDILFGKLRPYFRKVIRPRLDGICSTDIWVVRPAEGVDAGWLFYLMASQEFVDHATLGSEGTRMPRAKWEHVRRYPVQLPPLDEQRRIAGILGTLDDKIELNRRMCETLEAMAQALFKSWFVDFDPVRAKANGQPTNLPPEIDALFPNSFQESELGEIPSGWEIGSLGDVIELAYGKALRAKDRRRGSVPVYGSNGQIGWHDQELVAGPGIVVGRKGNPGLVAWSTAGFFPIDTTFYVVPRVPTYSLHFLFFALQQQDLPSVAADSAVPGLNRNLAYMNRLTAPPPQLVQRFDDRVGPLFARNYSLEAESAQLASLRDALLSELLSDQVAAAPVYASTPA